MTLRLLWIGKRGYNHTREPDTINVHIIFYRLKYNAWKRDGYYIEDDGGVDETNAPFNEISVELSDKVAFIGFTLRHVKKYGDDWKSGIAFAFEHNSLGVWEQRDGSLQYQDKDSEVVSFFWLLCRPCW